MIISKYATGSDIKRTDSKISLIAKMFENSSDPQDKVFRRNNSRGKKSSPEINIEETLKESMVNNLYNDDKIQPFLFS